MQKHSNRNFNIQVINLILSRLIFLCLLITLETWSMSSNCICCIFKFIFQNFPFGWYNWSKTNYTVTHKHSWPDPLGLQASSRPRMSQSPRQSGCRNSWSGLCLPGTRRSRRWSVCSQWSRPGLSRCQNQCCGWPDRGAGSQVRQGVWWEGSTWERTPLQCVQKG